MEPQSKRGGGGAGNRQGMASRGGNRAGAANGPRNHHNTAHTQPPEEVKTAADVKTEVKASPGKVLDELKLAAVTNEGLKMFSLECATSKADALVALEGFPELPTAEIAKFSPLTGQYLAVVEPSGVHVIDVVTRQVKHYIQRAGVASLDWSPQESYLITCTKDPTKAVQSQNLTVWDVQSGKQVNCFDWQNQAQDGAASVKFDDEQKFCARQVAANAIDVYDASNLQEVKFQIVSKLPPLPKGQEDNRFDNSKFDGFLFCPVPEENRGQTTGVPCFLMCWQNGEVLSDSDDNGLVYVYDLNSNLQRPKFNIACPRASSIEIRPAPSGHAILVWSQNLQDSTGKSYYGEHSLQFIRVHKGKTRKYLAAFDNTVQDVTWSADGKFFVVIAGQQPAQATLYHGDEGVPFFELGRRFRSVVRFCPFTHLVMLGGFGNITKGEIDFWTVRPDGSVASKEAGKAQHSCASMMKWSSCGRYVLTAVLYERLKVDNAFHIFRANGSKVLDAPITAKELHSVDWQPHRSSELAKPDLKSLQKDEMKKPDEKPKKLFKFGKGGESNSSFHQMMRNTMGASTTEDKKGPHKVDRSRYDEVAEQQTAAAVQHIQSQANNLAAGMGQSAGYSGQAGQTKLQAQLEKMGLGDNLVTSQPAQREKKQSSVPNWRMGKFHDDGDEDQYLTEQLAGEKKGPTNVNVNIGNVKVVEGGGKKKKNKKKGQVAQPSHAATQQQQEVAMPQTDDFPSLV